MKICVIALIFIVIVIGYLIFELFYVCYHGSPCYLDRFVNKENRG